MSQLDIEKLKTELGVERLALEAARDDLPPSDATGEDANEFAIEFHLAQTRASLKKRASDRIQNYRVGLIESKHRRDKIIEDVKAIPSIYKENSKVLRVTLQSDLNTIKSRIKQYKKDLDTFTIQNGISRLADYPVSRFYHISLLIFILVLETILNGLTFREASEFGYLGGVSLAFLVSLLNVSIGFTFGLIPFKEVNHVNTQRRRIGYISIAIFIVLSPAINFFVAHFRDNISSDNIQSALDTIQSIANTPFRLSIYSWLLFGLGSGFSIAAMIDGLKFDDVYPGYGIRARRVDKADGERENMEGRIKQELTRLNDKTLRNLRELERKFDVIEINMVDMNENAKRRAHEYQDECNEIDHIHSILVLIYRETNRKHRTSPPPRYFRQPINQRFAQDDTLSFDEARFSDIQDSKLFNDTEAEVQSLYRSSFTGFDKSVK